MGVASLTPGVFWVSLVRGIWLHPCTDCKCSQPEGSPPSPETAAHTSPKRGASFSQALDNCLVPFLSPCPGVSETVPLQWEVEVHGCS